MSVAASYLGLTGNHCRCIVEVTAATAFQEELLKVSSLELSGVSEGLDGTEQLLLDHHDALKERFKVRLGVFFAIILETMNGILCGDFLGDGLDGAS